MPAKESVGREIGVNAVKDLLDLAIKTKDKIGKFASDLSDAVKAASETRGLHIGAFMLVVRLKRMGEKDSIRLSNFLAAFDRYRGIAKLDDLADEQPELPEYDEKAPKNGAGKVTALADRRKPKGPVAVEAAADRAEETSGNKPH